MKQDDEDRAKAFELLEESVKGFAEYYSCMMELVEACDWDDDKAVKIFETVSEGLIDIHEFSKFDKSLVSNTADLENLLRMNTNYDGEEITNSQYRAVMNLLLFRAKLQREQDEIKKQLN